MTECRIHEDQISIIFNQTPDDSEKEIEKPPTPSPAGITPPYFSRVRPLSAYHFGQQASFKKI